MQFFFRFSPLPPLVLFSKARRLHDAYARQIQCRVSQATRAGASRSAVCAVVSSLPLSLFRYSVFKGYDTAHDGPSADISSFHSTHRERKESYVKALEDKVVQLRAREESARSANEALRSEVARLRGIVGAPSIMGMGMGAGVGAGVGIGSGTGQWGSIEGAGGAWETELNASGSGNDNTCLYSQGEADMDMVVWDGSSRVSSVEGLEGEAGEHWGEYSSTPGCRQCTDSESASPRRLGSGSPYSLDSQGGLGPEANQTDLAMEFVME